MRIAVFSDSHGNTDPAIDAVYAHQPQLILHLGDYSRDADAIQKEFPHIELHSVRGNCDLASRAPLSELFEAGGLRIYMAHGHEHGVKLGLDGFRTTALCAGARIALFGHTHRAYVDEIRNILFLNPGPAQRGGSFALLEVEGGVLLSYRILPL